MNAGMKDMLNVMSKFLNFGMSVEDVVLRSTWNPAKEIKHEDLGHISVGDSADISVIRIEKGKIRLCGQFGRPARRAPKAGMRAHSAKRPCRLGPEWNSSGRLAKKNGVRSAPRMGWHPSPQTVEGAPNIGDREPLTTDPRLVAG